MPLSPIANEDQDNNMRPANTILIVDDDPLQREMYATLLHNEGYAVRVAHSAQEGFDLMREDAPDLVVLDVVLPDANGMEMCRKIKTDPRLHDIPVLLYSGMHWDPESQAKGLESGADDFVAKSVQFSEFMARVKALFKTRQVDKDLRTAHREIYQIISSIQSLLIVLNEHNQVVRWNWVAAKLLNRSLEQVAGKSIESLEISWEGERVLNKISRCKTELVSISMDDLWFERPDGKDGFLRLNIDPMLDIDGGLFTGVVLLGEDITEQKVLENQLLQAQKLESIGQLAAGIAHEINTPIQFISDNTRFLKDAFQEVLAMARAGHDLAHHAEANEAFKAARTKVKELAQSIDFDFLAREIPQAVEQSLDGLNRAAHIVRSMKSFAHPGGEGMSLGDINSALENTVTVSRNEWKYVAEMHMELDPDLPLIQCQISELNQAFLNIVTNAAHAIAARFGPDSRERGRIEVSSRLDGDWVEIRITDNGGGIPPEIQDRIFNPFFTTKEVGKGTGQGLVISQAAIVKLHGGTLTFTTEPKKSTTFIIRLPIQQEDQKTPAITPSAEDSGLIQDQP